ncbi:hypothetical protein [Halobacillus sp. BBL2006]|uniref:hypothetical protein n=1 Tax=Halobacillus sp. BBL2006 TaxID=1543706 RepID=UPI0005428586|nr:hypothetical protein [Halobacillus sp. BBL2006]KHE73156.1 hypothetical protein LD39_00770 [Halobacillus sp. BBL2006]
MSVEIKGLSQLTKKLDQAYGPERMKKLTDKALILGAEAFMKIMKEEFENFKDTGASIDEMTRSEPMTIAGKRTVKIYWKGPKNRFRIIHLNEFGTVKNPNPAGKGAIARSLKAAEKVYQETLRQVLMRG